MDKNIKILIIGTHKEISDILLRLINQVREWEGILAINEDEASLLFTQHPFDIVLFSSGVDEQIENRLRTSFKMMNPSIIIIQHYGGGSGLLKNEIQEALDSIQ